MVHGAVAGSLTTRLPWIQENLHLSPGMLGLVLLCPPIGAFIGMPLASRLSYRFGGRATTRILLALWCAAVALPALAPGVAWLFPIFMLYGMASGMCNVVMNAHAVDLELRLKRSIMSGMHGMWAVGSLTGGGIGALAAQLGVDARLHLGVLSVVILGCGVLVGRGLHHSESIPDAPKPKRFTLPTRSVLAIGVVGFCSTFAEGASANWSTVYLTNVADASPGLAAATYMIYMFCMGGTRLLGDLVIGRFGPVAVVRVGGIVAAVGGVTVVAGRTAVICAVGFALIGFGLALVVPLVFAAAGKAGRTPGEGVAGVASITYLSGLTAPAITGWIAGSASYPTAFAVITGVIVVLVLLAPVMRPAPTAAPIEPLLAHAK